MTAADDWLNQQERFHVTDGPDDHFRGSCVVRRAIGPWEAQS